MNHALIESLYKHDTPTAISLFYQGADANAFDSSETPVALQRLMADFRDRLTGKAHAKDERSSYLSAIMLGYPPHESPPPIRFIREDKYEEWSETKDDPELMLALLEHGANPNVADIYGETLLGHACQANHIHTVSVLLEHHVDPNVRDKNGFAPVMAADYDCARLLIKYGARVSFKERYGRTALDYARLKERDSSIDQKNLILLLEAALQKEQAEQHTAETDTK